MTEDNLIIGKLKNELETLRTKLREKDTRAEELLRESENRLALAVKGTGAGLWDWSIRTGEVVFNERWAEIIGYTLEELSPVSIDTWTALCHPDDQKTSFRKTREHLTGRSQHYECEARMKHKDGFWVWVLGRGRISEWDEQKRPVRMTGTHVDISKRKKVEEELLESRERFRSLYENSTIGMYRSTPEGEILMANSALVKMLGYSSFDELKTNNLEDPGFEPSYSRTEFKTLMEEVGIISGLESIWSKKDGTKTYISESSRAFRNSEDKIHYYEGTVVDISQRKMAQQELERSHDQLKLAFDGTIKALAGTIKVKDAYTSGHQKRVTHLACAIGRKLELSEDTLEGLRIAATVHDVGKISIPAEILYNPDTLRSAEMELIRLHAIIGFEIMKDIDFPWPVALIVSQHHERLDGSGYPKGLKGDEIKFEAKILAVADVVESMSSHRPYRPSKGVEKALEHIVEFKGIMYDPEVVDVCVELFRNGFVIEDM